ncbi:MULTISPECIES: ParB/RepB/Spo0J family partition protein [Marinobacter]|uniref:ParB/RepB/Spo0J family partition protein n=1 Tax=Marinobacter TaxID=2742 RepID=UPI0007DA06B0|nr:MULTISPECIES: ParB/RepB/Spo0J family partition protein [unclassified Marinobacter]MBL3823551.1 ParB/RepB/Spo0J family partition protein [Marinobacter sp. MC3]MBL3891707.1 ParB/RepB/Spo0J family partition protein [Marinobacter sp. MW3]OAN89090.1 chromosome partitioning protein ParB [Marinobacter sp. EhN04]OAN92075.1 chromosome partitioning protein ParB [Marinobacter sp. EhC06]
MAAKKRGLGERGLGALLAGSKVNLDQELKDHDGELREVPIDLIQRGRYQPRRDMDPAALQELADSIRQQGVMQPVVVRPIAEGRYELIAGERRWRATQMAGLDSIPAIIRDVPDEAAIAMALIENIQRENLNPIEEAFALQRLQDEFGLTQAQVAEAVGKSRTTITNLLRLIGLSEDVRIMLEHGDLEMGHGRAMLTLAPELQMQVAKQVVAKSLSVRQTEALVRRVQQETPDSKSRKKGTVDPNIRALQDDLAERLGARVSIDHGQRGKGKLVIEYSSLDELDGILGHIK